MTTIPETTSPVRRVSAMPLRMSVLHDLPDVLMRMGMAVVTGHKHNVFKIAEDRA